MNAISNWKRALFLGCAFALSVSALAQTPQATLDQTLPEGTPPYLQQIMRDSNQGVPNTVGSSQQGFRPPALSADQAEKGQSSSTRSRDARTSNVISTGPTANRVVDLKLMDDSFADLRGSVQQDQPGVKRVEYELGRVIPVTVRQNAPVDIILPEWEVVEDPRHVSIPVPWIVAELTAPNALRVTTKQIGFDGPLKVTGRSGTIYVFWLTVTGIRQAQLSQLKGAQGLGADGTALPDLMVIVEAPDPAPPPANVTPRRSTPVRTPVRPAQPATAPNTVSPAQPSRIDYASIVNDGLSPALRALVPAVDQIRVPHRILEKKPGDALAIGPIQVIEAGGFTFLDFGDDGKRPRPAISLVLNGVDSAAANPMIHPDQPNIVILDKVGSFTLEFDGRIVCILRTKDEYGGLKEASR